MNNGNSALEGPKPVLSFRRGRSEDVERIVALVNSAYRGESSKAGWTTEADLLGGQRTDATEVTELIGSEDSMMLLCLADGEVIGCVHLRRAGADAHLGMFVVKPVLQGRGIGKRFLAITECVVRDVWQSRTMIMAVITYRHELIAYYERRGYRRTDRLEDFPSDTRFGIPKVGDLRFELLEKDIG